MIVLGLETTCDETGCALVRDGKEILSNVVSSQIDLHQAYGGVVPELACRRHVDVLIPVLRDSLAQAQLSLTDVDLIAVAHGPGLVGAVLIGLNAAKALAYALDRPLIGVNHIEAHLYAGMMATKEAITFPCLGVVLSGGHTALVLIRGLGDYLLLGQTADDAIGEAFDKVARMLHLPYPGGPEIERLAKQGNAKGVALRAGKVKGRPLDFSFSGLKTAVLYQSREGVSTADLAASFQAAAFQDILSKTVKAALQERCDTIVFGGGVTANQALRQLFAQAMPERRLVWPPMALTLDNAAMIAGLGYQTWRRRGPDSLTLDLLKRWC